MLSGFISSEALSNVANKIICPEYFTPLAIGFAERLLPIGPSQCRKVLYSTCRQISNKQNES